MFALTDNCRYFAYDGDVDMRNGINGLYKIVKGVMRMSPISGDVFVFFSRNRRQVKILRWDTDGFLLYQKRLEKGTFERPRFNTAEKRFEMPWKTFSLIMQGVCLEGIRYRHRLDIGKMA